MSSPKKDGPLGPTAPRMTSQSRRTNGRTRCRARSTTSCVRLEPSRRSLASTQTPRLSAPIAVGPARPNFSRRTASSIPIVGGRRSSRRWRAIPSCYLKTAHCSAGSHRGSLREMRIPPGSRLRGRGGTTLRQTSGGASTPSASLSTPSRSRSLSPCYDELVRC